MNDPFFVAQPGDLSRNAGETASFHVDAVGHIPLGYQWYKDGDLLSDNDTVSGSATSSLTLSNVLGSAAGHYQAVASNVSGSRTSNVARLDVIDPVILSHPASSTYEFGDSTIWEVTALGAAPLTFQWYKDGALIADTGSASGSSTATLALSNVAGSDSGSYRVVVTSDFGSRTSHVATLDVIDPIIVAQPVSQTRPVGDSTSFSLVAAGSAPLHHQWWHNGVAITGATNATFTLENPQLADAGAYHVVVTNQHGTATSSVANLTFNLATPDEGFDPGLDARVAALAVQPDGKVIVAGYFNPTGTQFEPGIVRLHPDGTLDETLNVKADYPVSALALQEDGEVVVAGSFGRIAGVTRERIARLHRNGTRDANFTPSVDGRINALALQTDGTIIIGGDFWEVNGESRYRIARLHGGGGLDTTFRPDVNRSVYTLALQPDGKVLLGGAFTTVNGHIRNHLARLNPNGTLDETFDPNPSYNVYSLAVQPDGKILVAGGFSAVDGQPRRHLARLNPDGTLDASFEPDPNGAVSSMVLQTDGKILAGGGFTEMGGQSRRGLARLGSDGVIDSSFNPEAYAINPEVNATINAIALQPDGDILVGGDFGLLAGEIRRGLGRLKGTDPASQYLGFNDSTFSWLRSGSGPEVSNATFEYTTDGFFWTALGDGVRSSAGWQLGVDEGAVPQDAMVRVRGMVSGSDTGSRWFATSFFNDPLITSQPLDQSRKARESASFEVSATGNEPLKYQWFGNDLPLRNGSDVAGANTRALTLKGLYGEDAGDYYVVVSSLGNSRTSHVARLTVTDPLITRHPTSETRYTGESVQFEVEVIGSYGSYQWLHDGVPIPGARSSTLTLTNIGLADAGGYSLGVSNHFGSAISSEALLTVHDSSPDEGYARESNGRIHTLAVQPDGKILVGGAFSSLGLQRQICLARFNLDGTMDTSFKPDAKGSVMAMAVQPDGKIVVGGWFNSLGGRTHIRLGRLNPDGTADDTFDARDGVGVGARDSPVELIVLQPDGKILLGGEFNTFDGRERNRLARVNPDGTLDETFDPDANGRVRAMAIQRDGKILVGGDFTTIGGRERAHIARLHSDGTLDESFDVSADDFVIALAVSADGKIYLVGAFTSLGGHSRDQVARLNSDGTVDEGFNSNDPDRSYGFRGLQSDGKIIVSLYTPPSGIGGASGVGSGHYSYERLNPDGSIDDTFALTIATSYPVGFNSAWVTHRDGDVLMAHEYGDYESGYNYYFGKLNAPPVAAPVFSVNGSTLTWTPGENSPEVWRATFEHSSDGITWALLGDGTRVDGGWQLEGMSAPPGGSFRARGFVADINGKSGWFVESHVGEPVFTAQPKSQTVNSGDTAKLCVVADGVGPFSYQWFKNGEPLADGGKISGAMSDTLTVNGVLGIDAGRYHVRVSDPVGDRNSLIAQLEVVDPVIVVQPADTNRSIGQEASLWVEAVGTAPLDYQWWQNGIMIPGATNATLTFNRLHVSDAGSYSVTLSNTWGELPSSEAVLTVNAAPPDESFAPDLNMRVDALAVQPDGKIIVAGSFLPYALPGKHGIVRLNSDGTVDETLNLAANYFLRALALQNDGKILVAGYFTRLDGEIRGRIARLNGDGTLDESFTPLVNDWVNAMVVQADGRILLGGGFTEVNGQTHHRIARLHVDGSLDDTFNPDVNGVVVSLAVQADGRVLLGGNFTSVNGQARARIARLNADGTLDESFDPGTNGFIEALALHSDGKIWVAGGFGSISGQARNGVARFHADGTLDEGFVSDVSGLVMSIAVQADGGVVVGGSLIGPDGASRGGIARLHPDGSLDTAVDPHLSGGLWALTLQPDGNILFGGWMTSVSGHAVSGLARLINPAPAMESLTYDGSTATWMRGGSSPEVWRTTFEYSLDGVAWTPLGAGARIPGGWQLDGLAVPIEALLRARGFVSGGDNASGWFAETLWSAGPDLEVVAVGGPLIGEPGAMSEVSWTIRNRGFQPTAGGWLNRLYLSDDPVAGGDAMMGEFLAGGVLETDASATSNIAILLPSDLDPDRDYWWVLIADAANDLDEEVETNNVRVSPRPTHLISDDVQVRLGNAVALAGASGCVPVFVDSDNTLTNLAFIVETPSGRFLNVSAHSDAAQVESVLVEHLSGSQSLITVTTFPGEAVGGGEPVAEICFDLAFEQTSAFSELNIGAVFVQRRDGGRAGNDSGEPGRVVVIGEEALLEANANSGQPPALVLYGPPGSAHQLQSKAGMDSSPWMPGGTIQVPDDALFEIVQPVEIVNGAIFIRAVKQE